MSVTITETISGDTPASLSLVTLLRSDTGLPPSGVTLPITYVNAGGGIWNATFTDPDSAPPTYTYTFTITFSDGSTYGPYPGSLNVADAIQAVVQGVNFRVGQDEKIRIIFPPAVDVDDNPVNLSTSAINFIAWTSEDGGATKTTAISYNMTNNVSVSGTDGNIVTVALQPGDLDEAPVAYSYDLIDVTSGPYRLADGVLSVAPALMN